MHDNKDVKEMDLINQEANEEAAQDYLRIRTGIDNNFFEGIK
ncbi:hypothetical protein [Desulfallas thermosapovorans]|uniref:Uncharacterized protein n=1 Tax=Desulfallas thermosapovorans DSM 6562 TaxID=1121431 RepID=A0A5S4ZQV8_9FIRM|nr:hypothetical protein [Desulfallas thermosapovorans]TYO95275.1 hypothetical protein LX24_01624 [Desulfallas thermosapovorans DSM 6562]